ncbi:hypothetical protein KUTeg_024643, partial [Tegillarca granosa]
MTDSYSYQGVTAMSSGKERNEKIETQTKRYLHPQYPKVTTIPVMLNISDTSSSDTDNSDTDSSVTNSSDADNSDSSYSLLDTYIGSSLTKTTPWNTTSQKRILMLEKEKNFTRLAIMLNDIVPKAVREFFNEHVSRSKLLSSLEDPKISSMLEENHEKDVLKLNYLDLNSRLRLLLKTQLGELISSEERAALNAVITISGRKFRKKMSTLHDISGMALSEQQGSEAEDKYREFPEMSKREDEDSDSEISGDDDNVDWGNDRKAGDIVGDVSKSDDADSGDDICIGGCEEDCSNESRDDSGNENGYKAYTNNVVKYK